MERSLISPVKSGERMLRGHLQPRGVGASPSSSPGLAFLSHPGCSVHQIRDARPQELHPEAGGRGGSRSEEANAQVRQARWHRGEMLRVKDVVRGFFWCQKIHLHSLASLKHA